MNPQPGDRVEWAFGTGSFGGTARGEVLDTDLSKFGHEDVIKVAPDGSATTFIRSDDVTRVF